MPSRIPLQERLAFQLYSAEHLILRAGGPRSRRLPLWFDLTEEQRQHYRALAAAELEWLRTSRLVPYAATVD